MFKAEINRYEDSYRVLSSDNKSLFKGTSQECDDYIKGKTMKVIKVKIDTQGGEVYYEWNK